MDLNEDELTMKVQAETNTHKRDLTFMLSIGSPQKGFVLLPDPMSKLLELLIA